MNPPPPNSGTATPVLTKFGQWIYIFASEGLSKRFLSIFCCIAYAVDREYFRLQFSNSFFS